jgi:hypothetical protein
MNNDNQKVNARAVDYRKEAKAARDKYRAQHDMPQGTQAQHWTKERSAKAAGLARQVMNRNLSTLQSRKNRPATTLLTDPKGGGTRYSVKGGTTYGNEHKFADRHLIPSEAAKLRAANPQIDPKVVPEVAGGVARWKMTGDPGSVPKHLLAKVDIGKGEKPDLNPGGGTAINARASSMPQPKGGVARSLGSRPKQSAAAANAEGGSARVVGQRPTAAAATPRTPPSNGGAARAVAPRVNSAGVARGPSASGGTVKPLGPRPAVLTGGQSSPSSSASGTTGLATTSSKAGATSGPGSGPANITPPTMPPIPNPNGGISGAM